MLFCKILDIYGKYQLNLIELVYVMSFSNPKYMNPTRTQK